jgi:hypothetical protein
MPPTCEIVAVAYDEFRFPEWLLSIGPLPIPYGAPGLIPL